MSDDSDNSEHLLSRTKQLALRIIGLVEAIPNGRPGEAIARQLIRSGTAVGANYRSSRRARSIPDMIAKMKIAEEEADETLFWLELLIDSELISASRLKPLYDEIDEILAMIVASIKTLRKKGK